MGNSSSDSYENTYKHLLNEGWVFTAKNLDKNPVTYGFKQYLLHTNNYNAITPDLMESKKFEQFKEKLQKLYKSKLLFAAFVTSAKSGVLLGGLYVTFSVPFDKLMKMLVNFYVFEKKVCDDLSNEFNEILVEVQKEKQLEKEQKDASALEYLHNLQNHDLAVVKVEQNNNSKQEDNKLSSLEVHVVEYT